MTPQQKSEYNRKYREKHRDYLNAANAAWRAVNNARHRANARRWQVENADRFRANQQRWKAENGTYSRDYYHSTEQRRSTIRLRAALCQALKNRGKTRQRDWRADSYIGQLVACTKAELVAHFERQFQFGMSWENYGRGGWEVDHIIPCGQFDLTDPAQQRVCFHYTNLRPLWRADNLSRPKGRA